MQICISMLMGNKVMESKAPCWWSLNSKSNHQLIHKLTWNESQTIVIGFDSNKFHEFWCSHLSCTIFNFSPNKLCQMMKWTTPLRRACRANWNGYIICYIWSSEWKDINFTNKKNSTSCAAGLIGPNSEFGPLRPMCILMRYGGKFSTNEAIQRGRVPSAPHK